MKHEINIENLNIRTDLIIESINKNDNNKIDKKSKKINGIKIDEINITQKSEKYCNKKKGRYITISFDDATDEYNKKKLEKVVIKELDNVLEYMNILDNNKCLIVGLGNDKSTADSLGPKVIDSILVTRHLFNIDGIDILDGYRNVSVFKPSVFGITGIESIDVIKGIISKIKPDFLIIIDSLASSSIERVNKTIQLTTSGIFPGSGIGNNRGELSNKTLGIPVLAIGIPTVVDAVTIVSDTINYIFNVFENKSKLNQEEKKKIMGEIGMLNDNEIKKLLFEVLTPIGCNMIVSPKEEDFVIEKLSQVLANSINHALHKNINIID